MKSLALLLGLFVLAFSAFAQEVDSNKVEIKMTPFDETPKGDPVLLDSTNQEPVKDITPEKAPEMEEVAPVMEEPKAAEDDKKGYQERKAEELATEESQTFNYYDFLMMITGHYESYMTEVNERDEDGEITDTWAAVKLENMKITGTRKEVSDGWKSYWKGIKKEPDGTVILKDGKVFIGFDLILNNVEFEVLWLEDLDIGNVTLDDCTFQQGIHLKDVNIKDMEVKTRVKKKMKDKKNSFIIHDCKIKRLTVGDLDQFFKFRQQDSNIDRLDIF